MYDRENRGTDITSTQDKSARETIGSVCFEVFAFTEQDQDHCAVDDLEYWKLGYAASPVGASVGADKLGYLLVRKGEREKKHYRSLELQERKTTSTPVLTGLFLSSQLPGSCWITVFWDCNDFGSRGAFLRSSRLAYCV